MNSPESNGNRDSTKTLAVASRPVRGGLMGPASMEPSQGARSRRPPEPEAFDPSVLLHSLRRRWPLALLLGLIFGPPLAAAAWFMLVPKYAAVAYLQIDSQNAPLVFQTADREGGRSNFDLYKNTQAELFKTPFVLNKALAAEGVHDLDVVKDQPNAYQWLAEELEVGFPNKGELMQVKLETEDPANSVKIVAAIVDAYMTESVLDERNERLQRLDNLERVFAETEGKVRARRGDIGKLADALGTSDSESLSVAQQMSIQRYGQVQSELGKVTFDLMRAEGELDAYRQLAAKLEKQKESAVAIPVSQSGEEKQDTEELEEPVLSEFEVERLLSGDRTYQGLISERRQIEDRIALYRTQYGEGMIRPELAKLERLEAELSKRGDQLVKLALGEKRRRIEMGDQEMIDPRLSLAEQEALREKRKLQEEAEARASVIAEREIRIGVLKQQKSRIEEDLARLEADSKKLGRSSVDVEMMRAEIASLDDVLQRLAGEIERTKIELKGGQRVEVVSEATGLESSDAKKRYAASAGLGLFGFMLPFVAFVGFDVRKKLINDADSVSRDTGLTVLGAVPRERNIKQQLSAASLVEGAFGNSVSSIVAMLVNQSKFQQSNVLMVTSAVAGEGKSTLSQSLWHGLAEANYRTILLDFDLRRPSIHLSLERDPKAGGIAEIIRGQVSWEDVVHRDTENRSVIFAGEGKHLNLAAASQDILPQLFAELRDRYDFVIVDTAPILPVVDTRVIGEHVDAAVLAVMKDRSRLPQIVAATETLRAHGTPLLGVVVNACRAKTKDYGYYY